MLLYGARSLVCSPRAYDVVEPLCGLLEKVMLDERVRRLLATGENFRVLTAMTNVSYLLCCAQLSILVRFRFDDPCMH